VAERSGLVAAFLHRLTRGGGFVEESRLEAAPTKESLCHNSGQDPHLTSVLGIPAKPLKALTKRHFPTKHWGNLPSGFRPFTLDGWIV